MGFYARHLGPRLVSCACSLGAIEGEREKIVPRARGVVLEIGIGPGFNLPLYDPSRVERVIGVDPVEGFVALGRARRERSAVPVELLVAPAEQVPLPDDHVDTAVITYTLCSVEDPVAALREVRRVLRPSGQVLFLEHGLSNDEGVARWQNRLNPIWRPLALGCNLNRHVRSLVGDNGFRIDEIDEYYLPGAPKAVGFLSLGSARPA